MKTNDFLVYTFEDDSASPPSTYVAEIISLDPASGFFTCRQVDTGKQFTFQYLKNASGPWQGEDESGTSYSIVTHDAYAAGNVDPSPQGVALVTFSDNQRYLCNVDSVSPTIDVVFLHQPYPQLSFDTNNTVTKSDWDAYPTGTGILSIAGCALDNETPESTSTTPTETSAPVRPYTVESWGPLVTKLAGDIPVAFVQAWNTKESGGNPCAFGSANAQGPDGNPLEMGLGQLYNPDDFQALGIDAGSWRAYCEAGTQNVTRDLTADECTSQVTGLVGLINRCRTAARKYNPGWSESSADFWRLVKLNHALPGLLQGMTAVTKQLGRAPNDWAEFRATVVTVTLDSETMKYSSNFDKELDNAETTGGAV
jgi:hypothetical protein